MFEGLIIGDYDTREYLKPDMARRAFKFPRDISDDWLVVHSFILYFFGFLNQKKIQNFEQFRENCAEIDIKVISAVPSHLK